MSNIFILNIKLEFEDSDISYSNRFICYTLDEAIESGIEDIKWQYNNISNTDTDITDIELENFINKITYFEFSIDIISGNRKRFNTSKELMDYFNTNIKNISNDNLYDFLLSLVESDRRLYDYKGNFISSEVSIQIPKDEYCIRSNVQFSMESCRNGEYRFEYRYED